jgi:hypothetical protein
LLGHGTTRLCQACFHLRLSCAHAHVMDNIAKT